MGYRVGMLVTTTNNKESNMQTQATKFIHAKVIGVSSICKAGTMVELFDTGHGFFQIIKANGISTAPMMLFLKQHEFQVEGQAPQPADPIAKAIYKVLMREDFARFYEGEFEAYVEGDDDRLTEEQMMTRIKQLFRGVVK